MFNFWLNRKKERKQLQNFLDDIVEEFNSVPDGLNHNYSKIYALHPKMRAGIRSVLCYLEKQGRIKI